MPLRVQAASSCSRRSGRRLRARCLIALPRARRRSVSTVSLNTALRLRMKLPMAKAKFLRSWASASARSAFFSKDSAAMDPLPDELGQMLARKRPLTLFGRAGDVHETAAVAGDHPRRTGALNVVDLVVDQGTRDGRVLDG